MLLPRYILLQSDSFLRFKPLLYCSNRLNLKVLFYSASVNCVVTQKHRYGCTQFVDQLMILYLVRKIWKLRFLEQSLLLQHVEPAGALLRGLLVSASFIVMEYIL